MSKDELHLTKSEQDSLPFLERMAQNLLLFDGLQIPHEDLGLLRSWLKKVFFAERPRVLDAGCGIGWYAGELADHFAYEGIDLSAGMLEVARKNNPQLNFQRASFARTPFPDGHFHGLWAGCVLNTTPKREMSVVFAEWKRVLKRRGIVAITMPMLGESEEAVHQTTLGVPVLYTMWDVAEFATAVHQGGFEVISVNERFEHGAFSVLAQKI